LLSYHSSSFLPHISFLLVHYVSFVFYSSPVHLLLLSFPTRRSSDLPHAYIDSNILGFTNVLEACRHNNVKHLIYASSSSVYGARSEEHTSELQSRFDLVCRLLLEKKKNTNTC